MASPVFHELRDISRSKNELISERVGCQRFDYSLVQFALLGNVASKSEVDVFGEACTILQTHLHGHATFEYPSTWFCMVKSSNDPFEDHSSAESVKADVGFARLIQ